MQKKRVSLRVSCCVAALAVMLGVAASAAAAPVTIGSIAPSTPASNYCLSSPYDVIQNHVTPGISFTVPTAGLLTSWSTRAGEGAGQQLTFKVFRPISGGKYEVVGVDGHSLTPAALNTFKIAMPVRAGDVIGLQDTNATEHATACILYNAANIGDATISQGGDVPLGGQLSFEIEEPAGTLLNVAATLLPAPTITSLSATSGSTAGGTAVTISGTDFTEVKGVSLGATAVPYSVDSEGQITFTTPPGVAGPLPVTVTTVAGTATSAQLFTYVTPVTPLSCTVPKLVGKKLKGAKKALGKAHCKIGKVAKKKGVTAKSGKVVKQGKKAGVTLVVGTKVSVKLG